MAGPDDMGSVATRPLLTCALILSCVGAYAFGQLGTGPVLEAVETDLSEARSYLLEHPFLVAPPLLEGRLAEGEVEEARLAQRERREKRGSLPTPPGIRRRRQQTLDAKVAAAAAHLEVLASQRWGLRPSEPDPSTWFSHVFAHAGWAHLAGNMLVLLILGTFLEGAWGRPLTALVGAASTLAGAATLVVGHPRLDALLIGTSPLLAGFLGAYAAAARPSWREGAYVPAALLAMAWLIVPVWLGHEWSLARELTTGEAAPAVGEPGVSVWAAAGAFACGAVCALGIRLLGVGVSPAKARDARRETVENPLRARALKERASGRSDRAFAILMQSQREVPQDLDAALALWDLALELERPTEAATAMLRVIRDELQRGESESAVDHWIELIQHALEIRADPALLIRIAIRLAEAEHTEAATDALRRALALAEGAKTTTVASRVARAAQDVAPEIASDAAWRALGSMDLALEERQRIEALLGQLQPRLASEPPAAVSSAAGTSPGPGRPLGEASGESARPEDAVLLEDVTASRPQAIEIEADERALEVVEVVPLEFGPEGIVVEIAGVGKKRVGFERVDGVAVAAVDGLGPRTVIVIDLLLNWSAPAIQPLRLLRLRGDRFDPRRFAPGCEEALEALRAFTGRLLDETGAAALPDARSARGMPFAAYPSLSAYQRVALMSDSAAGASFAWSEDD